MDAALTFAVASFITILFLLTTHTVAIDRFQRSHREQ